MKTLRSIVTMVLASCFAHLAVAGELRFGGVTLVVPDQFASPARAAPGSNAETIAFSVPRGAGVATNVLQLTRIDFDEPIRAITEDERLKATSQYLLQMLQGIERHRTSYTQSVPERTLLGGQVGARSTWKGELRDVSVNGVMYCILIGSRAIFFHAFGPGDTPDDELLLAVKAIESLRADG